MYQPYEKYGLLGLAAIALACSSGEAQPEGPASQLSQKLEVAPQSQLAARGSVARRLSAGEVADLTAHRPQQAAPAPDYSGAASALQAIKQAIKNNEGPDQMRQLIMTYLDAVETLPPERQNAARMRLMLQWPQAEPISQKAIQDAFQSEPDPQKAIQEAIQ